ncbi:hypothetical protein [Acidovorax sp.]|uniref:hypothetical protein n=1 Tax=Acidovorax sp. TaxID=1872122 RepID=UPI00391FC84D
MDNIDACAEHLDSVPVTYAKRPTPRVVLLPAQIWEDFADSYAGQHMCEAKEGNPASVPAKVYGGFLHVVTANNYGGFDGEYRSEAWQLLPRDLFDGPTHDFTDYNLFDEGVRARGDHTGLVLKVGGSEVVCAKPVHFLRGVPTTVPIGLEAAQQYVAESNSWGWRAHVGASNPSWWSLEGHPVEVYGDGAPDRRAALLYLHNGKIHEYGVHPDVELAGLESLRGAAQRSLDLECAEDTGLLQAALF